MTQNPIPIFFIRFPIDPGNRQKWIQATGRQNWIPSKHTRICSEHFEANAYLCNEQFKNLKSSAIPTKKVHEVSVSTYRLGSLDHFHIS